MNIDIKAVHFSLNDEIRDFIDSKLHKIDFVKDLIVDLKFTLTRNGHELQSFSSEANAHMRYGKTIHLKVDSTEVLEGLEKLIDKLDHQLSKEKEKLKSH